MLATGRISDGAAMEASSTAAIWEHYLPCMLCVGKWVRRDIVLGGSVEEACGVHDEAEIREFREKREQELAVAKQRKLAAKKKETANVLAGRGRLLKKPAGRGLQKKPAGRGLQKKPAGRGLQKKPAARSTSGVR